MNSNESATKISDIPRPTPVNAESRFNFNELFFSVTDSKSTITYANQVFVRISKYEEDIIIGQLHKLIRHPDMPRAVFYEFWNHLEANRPVAAYVKNMAKDGSFYWVMALAFPCDGGYLSVRLKPGSEFFERIKEVYQDVLAHEKSTGASGDKRKAMHKGHTLLLSKIQELGFATYDEFMWNALQREIQFREDHLHTSENQTNITDDHIPEELIGVEHVLQNLVQELGKLRQIHESLVGHSDHILKLSRSVLLLSKNAQISSSKLDRDDRSISVVAEKMGEQSLSGEKQLVQMQKNIFELSELIGKLNFNIISSKLQVEMTGNFLNEQQESNSANTDQIISTEKATNLLYNSFIPTINTIQTDLGKLPGHLKKLLSGVREIERFLLVLRFIHIKGKVEIARMNQEGNSFANTFNELINEVNSAETRLEKLSETVRKHYKTGELYSTYRAKLSELGMSLKAYRENEKITETEYGDAHVYEAATVETNDSGSNGSPSSTSAIPKSEIKKRAKTPLTVA